MLVITAFVEAEVKALRVRLLVTVGVARSKVEMLFVVYNTMVDPALAKKVSVSTAPFDVTVFRTVVKLSEVIVGVTVRVNSWILPETVVRTTTPSKLTVVVAFSEEFEMGNGCESVGKRVVYSVLVESVSTKYVFVTTVPFEVTVFLSVW